MKVGQFLGEGEGTHQIVRFVSSSGKERGPTRLCASSAYPCPNRINAVAMRAQASLLSLSTPFDSGVLLFFNEATVESTSSPVGRISAL